MHETAHTVCFSPKPRREYVVQVDGMLIGPGNDPRLGGPVGLWNLYFLSFPGLEKHAGFAGGTEALFPEVDPIADLAVKTAYQALGSARVMDLAAYLTPHEFADEMETRLKSDDDTPLTQMMSIDGWLSVMRDRAALFRPLSTLPAPGQAMTIQEYETKGKSSTNILPLQRLMKGLLH